MSTVLVISPHPDDEATGCGGVIRRHVLAGDDVQLVFLTSGEAGGHGRTPQDTIRIREAEARAAGAILGVTELQFWHEPDGALTATPALIERLRARIRKLAPRTLYVTHALEMHDDHRAAAAAVSGALADLPPESRPDVLTYEVWTPLHQLDEIVDITAFVEIKRSAIQAHRSQCAVIAFDEAILGLNRYRGEMLSWPEGEYAEVFARMLI